MTFDKSGNRFGFVALLIASALAFVGCGDDDDTIVPPADMGGGTDLGEGADMGGDVDLGALDAGLAIDLGTLPVDMGASVDMNFDAAFPTGALTINGTLREQPAAGSGGPIAGATVCVIVPLGGPCVTSAADGTFTATGLPADTEMLIELTAPMYHPALATVTSGTTDVTFNYRMAKRSTVALLGFAISTTIDATKGQVFVQSGMAAGTTVSIAPASGSGPFYATAAGVPSTTETATTTSGTSVFANVAPGDYVITFTNPSVTCAATGFAWAGTVAETTRITVQADHITSTVVDCL